MSRSEAADSAVAFFICLIGIAPPAFEFGTVDFAARP